MADEISQVVELECKGVYYLIKGSKETIGFAINMIKHLSDWIHEKWLNKPGNISWQKLQEVSEGAPPILEFPKEMFEETIQDGKKLISPFEMYCKEHNLRYCVMPDLNPNDDYVPIAVPMQDMAIHQEQIKAYMGMRIEKEESKDKDYDKEIESIKEKLSVCDNDEEKAELEKELAALVEAKGQNKELLEESKEKLDNDNIIEFTDYLKQGENSVLAKDVEEGFEQIKTCSLVKEFMPYECMYPIRDEGLMPDSKEIYYSQVSEDDTVYMIKRDFEVDEDGLVYSTYHVTGGENAEKEIVFSDKGVSKDAWKEQLPRLLKVAGLMADVPTAAIHGEDRMKAYVDGVSRNFNKARGESGDDEVKASSMEAEEFIKDVKEQKEIREAYDRSMYTTFVVPATAIMPSGEQITSLELAEGLVEGVTVEKMDSENAVVSIKDDATYRVECMDGTFKEMAGADIINELDAKSEAVQARAANRGRK